MNKGLWSGKWTQAMGLMFLTVFMHAAAQQTPISVAQGVRPAFDVATIKPTRSGQDGGRVRTLPGGQTFIASNVALKNLIMTAYSVKADQISGGPRWANSDGYDIEAKAGRAVGPAELMLMLQSLLADRFKLVLRDEKKMQPVYELVFEKPLTNLKQNKDGSESLLFPTGVGRYRATDVSMQYFAWSLSRFPDVGRVVIDKTGLSGGYDFDLQFTMTPVGQNPSDTQAEPGPSVFTALREQLGLKLESTRELVDFFVIDSAEKPSDN